jgi:hypothetical protein
MQWARLAVQTGQTNLADKLRGRISDAGLRAWVNLEKYRLQVSKAEELPADSWSKAVPDKGTLAQGLALQAYARFRAAHGDGKEVLQDLEAVEPEKIRPLGYVGVALGVQERRK